MAHCPIHGEYNAVQPNQYVTEKSCPTCNFIARAKKVHNNKYSYRKTHYIHNKLKVTITCPIHGDFEQRGDFHLRGHGCPMCCYNSKIDTKEFIKRCKEIYGNDMYSYEKSIYTKGLDDITVNCSIHGEFTKHASQILRGHGCPSCGRKYVPKKQLIAQFRQIHGDKYDYSLINYTKMKQHIEIICPKHGKFTQYIPHHLKGSGCSQCFTSSGETNIIKYLEDHGQEFEYEKMFSDCRNVSNNYPLRFDFFLPDKKLIIEYDGQQHFTPVNFGGRGKEKSKKSFERQQDNDKIKNTYCKNHNISLLRIPFTSKDNIPNIIDFALNEKETDDIIVSDDYKKIMQLVNQSTSCIYYNIPTPA